MIEDVFENALYSPGLVVKNAPFSVADSVPTGSDGINVGERNFLLKVKYMSDYELQQKLYSLTDINKNKRFRNKILKSSFPLVIFLIRSKLILWVVAFSFPLNIILSSKIVPWIIRKLVLVLESSELKMAE